MEQQQPEVDTKQLQLDLLPVFKTILRDEKGQPQTYMVEGRSHKHVRQDVAASMPGAKPILVRIK